MKDNVSNEPELLGDNEGHTCPRCGSRNIQFVMPTNCLSPKVYQDPETGEVKSDKESPDGPFYRFKCADCNLSTKNNVNLMKAIGEWNSLRDQHKKDI